MGKSRLTRDGDRDSESRGAGDFARHGVPCPGGLRLRWRRRDRRPAPADLGGDLDAGDTCHAAHAADELHSAVENADMPTSMRPQVDAVAGRLVDEVNCPPPPPAPEPEKTKPKPDEHGKHHGDEHFVPPGHVKHGGLVPPGHAKLKGEEG
jgi:hypothetical protein